MSIEAEYFRRLIERTRRDDAALRALGPLRLIDDEDSTELLRALIARWPLDRFEEINIAVEAPYDPRLKHALDPINPRYGYWAGGLALLPKYQPQVRRWLLGLVGRDIGGLVLTRDGLGWFEFRGRRQ